MTPKDIHQLIGQDLTEKIKESGKTPYHYYAKLGICSEPTLASILNGKGKNKVNLSVLFALYKAMGYNGISIKSEGITIEIVPIKKD